MGGEKSINEQFEALIGDVVLSFRYDDEYGWPGPDQHFTLVTDKHTVRFGATDLGVWIDEIRKREDADL